MTAVVSRPARVDGTTVAVGLMVLLAVVLAILIGTTSPPSVAVPPADAYLTDVSRSIDIAPTYGPNVVAAGGVVCGDLGRGATPAALVEQYARDGIGGDLYTRAAVVAIVESAQRTLCP